MNDFHTYHEARREVLAELYPDGSGYGGMGGFISYGSKALEAGDECRMRIFDGGSRGLWLRVLMLGPVDGLGRWNVRVLETDELHCYGGHVIEFPEGSEREAWESQLHPSDANDVSTLIYKLGAARIHLEDKPEIDNLLFEYWRGDFAARCGCKYERYLVESAEALGKLQHLAPTLPVIDGVLFKDGKRVRGRVVYHNGFLNTLMADGSVQPLTELVAVETWLESMRTTRERRARQREYDKALPARMAELKARRTPKKSLKAKDWIQAVRDALEQTGKDARSIIVDDTVLEFTDAQRAKWLQA